MQIRRHAYSAQIKSALLPLFLFIFVFLYVSFYTTSANIHGDAFGRVLLPARTIVETQNLLLYNPHEVMESSSHGVVYFPIQYPQLSQLSVALFYMVGSETLLKFFSPFFAALTSLFVYLLLRKRSVFLALLAGMLVIMINSVRIVGMTPLMEQILLFGAAASIYFYYTFLKSRRVSYLILAGLFIGFTVGIKQQGMIFAGVIMLHAFSICIYSLIKNRNLKVAIPFIGLVSLIVIASFAPLGDQIARNGTIEPVPSSSTIIPFLQPKYLVNPESIQEIESFLPPAYYPRFDSLLHVMKSYILYPMYYYRSMGMSNELWMTIFLTLFFLGLLYMFKRDRVLLSILFPVSVAEISVMYFGMRFWEYGVIGLATLSIFLAVGVFHVEKLILSFSFTKIRGTLMALILLALMIPMVSSNVTYVHQLNWKNSGRMDDVHLSSYKSLGEFIQMSDIPREAIFLGSSHMFRYYCERDIFWLQSGGGAKVLLILTTTDEQVALRWLQYYDISYISIENAQIKRRGLGDYMPSTGLLTYIDSSAHFKKIYDDGILRMYKILY